MQTIQIHNQTADFFSENHSSRPSTEKSELVWVRNAQAGDLTAFNHLILAFQDIVYRQALWILGDAAAAEDAAQEAFFRAYCKIATFDGPSFRAWILRIATNYCFDQLRRQRSHPNLPLESMNPETDEENETPSWLRDPCLSPEQMAERAELQDAVQQCMMALPVEYRTAISLVDIEGMSYQDAAEVLSMRLGSFKSRLSRARAKLMVLFKQGPHSNLLL